MSVRLHQLQELVKEHKPKILIKDFDNLKTTASMQAAGDTQGLAKAQNRSKQE